MDGDAPLAPGHPHLLAAVGALEIAVLPVVGAGAEGGPAPGDGADDLQEAKTITVQPDGTVEFVLKDGSQLVMPSLAFARQICPDLKIE